MSDIRRKEFATEVKAIGERRIRFVISTGDVDRDNDTIDPSGWELENFRRSPVVLWAHDQRSLPVARCVEIGVQQRRLVAVAEFPTSDLYPFGAQVFELVRAGFLSATSVGFRALEWKHNEARGGIDFLRMELLEFSVVPVPANQNALIAAAVGVDTASVKAWLARGGGDDDGVEIEVTDEAAAWARGLIAQARHSNPARQAGLVEVYDVDDRDLVAAIRASIPSLVHTYASESGRAAAKALRDTSETRELAQELAAEVAASLREGYRQVVGDEVKRALDRARGRIVD